MTAAYFEVGVDAIESVIRRNRDELRDSGLRVLRGPALRDFDSVGMTESKRRSLTVLTRRTVFNIAQLLTGSDVARGIRTYLLEIEEQATPEQRATAIERAAETRAQGGTRTAARVALVMAFVFARIPQPVIES